NPRLSFSWECWADECETLSLSERTFVQPTTASARTRFQPADLHHAALTRRTIHGVAGEKSSARKPQHPESKRLPAWPDQLRSIVQLRSHSGQAVRKVSRPGNHEWKVRPVLFL